MSSVPQECGRHPGWLPGPAARAGAAGGPVGVSPVRHGGVRRGWCPGETSSVGRSSRRRIVRRRSEGVGMPWQDLVVAEAVPGRHGEA